MGHSLAKVTVHLIWSTKYRKRLIARELRPKLFDHIVQYSRDNNIKIDSLGIQPEHVHMMVHLRSNQNVDDVAKLIKGESSHWINSENLIHPKFSWQKGYAAFSVGPSHVDMLRAFIRNQDEHHRTNSYMEEFRSTLLKHGLDTSDLGDGE